MHKRTVGKQANDGRIDCVDRVKRLNLNPWFVTTRHKHLLDKGRRGWMGLPYSVGPKMCQFLFCIGGGPLRLSDVA
jgi:hypothetical protein